MLENIHIQNFRCFEDFKADGFERINLIGGKNNSGKSCLLEGILTVFIQDTLERIAELRNEKANELFFENDKKITFSITLEGEIYNKKINNYNEVAKFKKGLYEFHLQEKVNYINQDITLPKIDPIASFDTIQINKLDKKFSEILKILDARIENLRSYSSKGNKLFVQTNHSIDLPISAYGDAVKNIVNYFIPIFEKKALENTDLNILLIDEIENGLHYTAHYDFWKKLFQLSKSENVQVFATSHSLEMIQAFNKVAKEEGEGAYFEMVRNEQTNVISALKHSTSILDEELENDLPIRGEIYKEKIILSSKLIDTLNKAVQNAQKNLKDKDIPIPFIRDGWIWQTLADGTEEKLEKLEPILEK